MSYLVDTNVYSEPVKPKPDPKVVDVLYEMSQLHDDVRRRQQLPTPQLFDELVAELRAFSATGEFGDDMCLVGMDVARLLPA